MCSPTSNEPLKTERRCAFSLYRVGILSLWREGLYTFSSVLRMVHGMTLEIEHVKTIAAEGRQIIAMILAAENVERTRRSGVQQLAIPPFATEKTTYGQGGRTGVATVTGSPEILGNSAADYAWIIGIPGHVQGTKRDVIRSGQMCDACCVKRLPPCSYVA